MYTRFDSPIGEITVAENGTALTHVLFKNSPLPAQAQDDHNALLRRARDAILCYLDGRQTTFDLPLAAQGTVFQESVWRALLTIPYGQTRTYAQIAAQIGNPKACRAVGMANHRNPVSILIPCHRVIGADGSLTGYGGGLENKVFLLELEHFQNEKALLARKRQPPQRGVDSDENHVFRQNDAFEIRSVSKAKCSRSKKSQFVDTP